MSTRKIIQVEVLTHVPNMDGETHRTTQVPLGVLTSVGEGYNAVALRILGKGVDLRFFRQVQGDQNENDSVAVTNQADCTLTKERPLQCFGPSMLKNGSQYLPDVTFVAELITTRRR